jgi:hypothetical protein
MDRPVMNKRPFYCASVLLAIVALVLHFVGRVQTEGGQHLKALRISAAVKQQIKYTPDLEAFRLSARARLNNRIGLIFTFTSLACMFIALIRGDQGLYSIPVLLLFFDAGLLLLL